MTNLVKSVKNKPKSLRPLPSQLDLLLPRALLSQTSQLRLFSTLAHTTLTALIAPPFSFVAGSINSHIFLQTISHISIPQWGQALASAITKRYTQWVLAMTGVTTSTNLGARIHLISVSQS